MTTATAPAPAPKQRHSRKSRPLAAVLTQTHLWWPLVWRIRYPMALALFIRLVVVAFCFRAIAAPSIDHGLFGAEMGWVARSLATGHGFTSPFLPITGATALVPPVFPALLALIFRCFGLYSTTSAFVVLALQSLFSALTCLPVSIFAQRAGGSRCAFAAAWLWALYPFAIHYSAAEVWDYSLSALLFATVLAVISLPPSRRRSWFWPAVGLLAGLTVLSNPSVLPVLLLVAFLQTFAVTLWRPHAARQFAAFMVGVLVVCGPWCLRNDRVLGHLYPVRDGFWLEMWAGNHGDTSVTNPPSAHPASSATEMVAYQQLGEVAYMHARQVDTLSWIQHHPAGFLLVSARRAIRFWTGFWSFGQSYLALEPFDVPNVFFCTGLTILMLIGLGKLRQTNRQMARLATAVLLIFPLPYYLSHASMDYREPIEPLVVVLVVCAFGIARDTRTGEQTQPIPSHSYSQIHTL